MYLQVIVLIEEQRKDIQDFCPNIRDRVDCATFEQKREVINVLDVRGTLANENDEKVVNVKCLIGQPQVSVVRTLPLSNNHKGTSIRLKARLVLSIVADFSRAASFDISQLCS